MKSTYYELNDLTNYNHFHNSCKSKIFHINIISFDQQTTSQNGTKITIKHMITMNKVEQITLCTIITIPLSKYSIHNLRI